MTPEEFVEECLKGGPGLSGYAYQADIYCEDCIRNVIMEELFEMKIHKSIKSTDDCEFSNSEVVPQPIFFGESDHKQHCCVCGEYLYGGNEDE